MASLAQQSSDRALTYRRLLRRNRVVAVLRWGVPALGVLVFAGLAVQIVIAQLSQRFAAAGISIDRGTLIVDTPRYSGTLSTGAAYTLSADEARIAVDRTNIIDVSGVLVTLTDGSQRMDARAAEARIDTTGQRVEVDGRFAIGDNAGNSGVLNRSVIDWPAQRLSSTGPAEITFADGTALSAGGGLLYDAAREVWTFTGVRLVIPGSDPAPPLSEVAP
jgi:lipopolysaccharide export system protein LptC